jgi:hypothetical protein
MCNSKKAKNLLPTEILIPDPKTKSELHVSHNLKNALIWKVNLSNLCVSLRKVDIVYEEQELTNFSNQELTMHEYQICHGFHSN